MNTYFFIILKVAPNIGNSLGEKIFIGLITSLFIGVYVNYILKRREKRELKKEETEKKIKEEKQYNKTLKTIIEESSLILSPNINLIRQELIDKCNPKNFLNDTTLNLKKATELYERIRTIVDADEILNIRKIAQKELNIKIIDNDLLTILIDVFNPKNFIDNNFNKERLLCCNKAYNWVLENREDGILLEKFAYEIGLYKDNQLGNKIPIVCDSTLRNSEGEIVYLLGIYPARLYIDKDFYRLIPINRMIYGKDFEGKELLKYMIGDYIGIEIFRIPMEDCVEISPDEVKHID